MVGLFNSSAPQVFTPLTIGADALAGWYIAKANAQAATINGPRLSGASSGRYQQDNEVAPPWDPSAKPSPSEEIGRRALATGAFVDDEDLEGYSDADAPRDHKQLFVLHQALKKLRAVAGEAADKNVSDVRRQFLDRRFQEGVDQVTKYLSAAKFDGVDLVFGEPRTRAESTVSITRGEDVYRTGLIHNGEYNAEVAAFQGSRTFTINVRKLSGDSFDVNIDLSEMGATPRTLDNVADYINDKLEAVDAVARFKRVKIGEKNEDGIVEGNRFGFEVRGVSTERITFSAPGTASGAVYLAGTSGRPSEDTTSAGQLIKLSGLADPSPTVESAKRIETVEGDDEVEGLTINDTAVAADGGLFVVGTTDVALDGGVGLRGEQDVVLVRYDSTGKRLWSRVLGASDSAEGRSIAVGPDGSVTVAGTIKGALGESIDHGASDAFATRYSATGAELWTHRFGGLQNEGVDSVAIGDDGVIYVAGHTQSPLAGVAQGGGQDAFVRAIDTDGKALWTRQFGGSGHERATALAIADDGALLVGSVEEGDGFLRKFSTADGTSPALWEHALGDLDEGSINAIHADDTGIYITGAARSGLNLAGALVGHSGARDAFVVALDDGASPSVRFETFLGSNSEDVAKDIAVFDGEVYIAGYTDGSLPSGGALDGKRNAFAAKFDATTGALDWTQQISGRGGYSSAAGLAVDTEGASDLDAFGLPAGQLVFQDEQAVAQRTSAREGDYFFISVNGRHKTRITLESDDTLRTLTLKINRVLVLEGSADVRRSLSKGDILAISPKAGNEIELFPGEEGRDLLEALGLQSGKARKPSDIEGAEEARAFGLDLARDLELGKREDAAETAKRLDAAMSSIRSAYRHLTRDPALDDALAKAAKLNGPAPAYLTEQIANYQDALARLGGGLAGGGFF